MKKWFFLSLAMIHLGHFKEIFENCTSLVASRSNVRQGLNLCLLTHTGGAPDMTAMTGGKFSSGISGCVRNLMLTNARPGLQPGQPIDLQAHAAQGINVQPCSS